MHTYVASDARSRVEHPDDVLRRACAPSAVSQFEIDDKVWNESLLPRPFRRTRHAVSQDYVDSGDNDQDGTQHDLRRVAAAGCGHRGGRLRFHRSSPLPLPNREDARPELPAVLPNPCASAKRCSTRQKWQFAPLGSSSFHHQSGGLRWPVFLVMAAHWSRQKRPEHGRRQDRDGRAPFPRRPNNSAWQPIQVAGSGRPPPRRGRRRTPYSSLAKGHELHHLSLGQRELNRPGTVRPGLSKPPVVAAKA